MTNNFVGLNLANLERAILEKNYVLKLFRVGSNLRAVRLEDPTGKLVTCGEGISLIPTLEKVNKNLDDHLLYKAPSSYKILDSHLDNRIINGSKLTIRRSEIYIRGTLTDWDDKVLLIKQTSHLMRLLVNIEHDLNFQA